MEAVMEIKEQKDYRKDFPLLNNNSSIYIDNAATAQKPQCVIDADFMRLIMPILSVAFIH